MQVVGDHRRRGIGTRLVYEASRLLIRQGKDRMFVVRSVPVEGMDEENLRAKRFYEATGASELLKLRSLRLLS